MVPNSYEYDCPQCDTGADVGEETALGMILIDAKQNTGSEVGSQPK